MTLGNRRGRESRRAIRQQLLRLPKPTRTTLTCNSNSSFSNNNSSSNNNQSLSIINRCHRPWCSKRLNRWWSTLAPAKNSKCSWCPRNSNPNRAALWPHTHRHRSWHKYNKSSNLLHHHNLCNSHNHSSNNSNRCRQLHSQLLLRSPQSHLIFSLSIRYFILAFFVSKKHESFQTLLHYKLY